MQESIYTLGWATSLHPSPKSEIEIICDESHDNWEQWWNGLSEEERKAENFKASVAEEVTRITCKPTQKDRERIKSYLEESRPSFYWERATDRIRGDLRLNDWQVISKDLESGVAMVATERDGVTYVAVGRHIYGIVWAIDLDSLSSDEYYY